MNIDDIINEINKIDVKDYFKKVNSKELQDDASFSKLFKNEIKPNINEKAVLGFDIYQYSQYDANIQPFIPVCFKLLMDEAITWCKDSEIVIFLKFDFDHFFIDTGDGGFLIFDNPLQAYTFNVNFYIQLKLFNTGHLYPKLHHYIKDITLRSCITYDKLYHLGNNYYGPAIIHNSRILSTDKLNRCLMDEKSNTWFNMSIAGIDRIKYFSLIELYPDLVKDLQSKSHENHSIYRMIADEQERIANTNANKQIENKDEKEKVDYCGIDSVHVQKIGTITVKKNVLSIYSIETQITSIISDENEDSERLKIVTTIGNLNASGLTV